MTPSDQFNQHWDRLRETHGDHVAEEHGGTRKPGIVVSPLTPGKTWTKKITTGTHTHTFILYPVHKTNYTPPPPMNPRYGRPF